MTAPVYSEGVRTLTRRKGSSMWSMEVAGGMAEGLSISALVPLVVWTT